MAKPYPICMRNQASFFFDFEHVGVYDVRCYGCDFVELGVGGILTYGVLGAFSLLFGLCLVKVG